MVDFSKRIKNGAQTKKIDPVEIYNTLDRSSSTGPLRPAQHNVLNRWYTEYRDKKDAIIKLHTGAGKTLIGLLIGLSYINSNEGPVMFVSPNIYLMQQACEDARKFGIPFCTVSKDNLIPNAFYQGSSILITHVQKVFNGLSIFGIGNRSVDIGCIILDDSHACIESMFASCTIQIHSSMDAYGHILELIEDDLKDQGSGTFQDLLNKRTGTLLPVPYWCWQNKIDELVKIVAANTDDNRVKFAWPLIKDHLADCRAYISETKIEITPTCMPIQQYGAFNNADHRILMSATTQEDTFFIKGLALSTNAVQHPLVDESYTWSGEKMILIPDSICETAQSDEVLDALLNRPHDFGIAVLTPSFEKAKRYEKLGAILANKPDAGRSMYTILKEYKENHVNSSIVFANRYDGIDLPDDLCRILIMDSVPYYDSLADRYEELCRSESEIVRIKTIQRIEQGLGRSVRGEKDYSVVLIIGSDLVKYIRSISNQRLFSPQTQKQIEIGFEIVDMVKEDLTEKTTLAEINMLFSTIMQCLNRDEGWKAYYASTMDEVVGARSNRNKLYTILEKERHAYDEMSARNYERAANLMQEIADICTEPSEQGWYLQEKARQLFHISHDHSSQVQIAAFKMNSQLLKPQSGIVYTKIKYPMDHSRAARIIDHLKKWGSFNELNIQLEDMLANLSFGIDAEKTEQAFYQIGQVLGYISQRPDKEIRKGPDVLWCVSQTSYILLECKTEVLATRKAIKKAEAGQMEEHCAWFESEYPGNTYLPILIAPTNKLADDAYFSRDVLILDRENLSKLKTKIRDFFKEFKAYNLSTLDTEIIHQKLVIHKLHDDSFLKQFLINPTK